MPAAAATPRSRLTARKASSIRTGTAGSTLIRVASAAPSASPASGR